MYFLKIQSDFGAFCETAPPVDVKGGVSTCTVAHPFILDDVFVVQRLEDLDFPLKVPEVLRCAVLQLLDGHHLPRAVLQGVVPAQLHAAKVSLRHRDQMDQGKPDFDRVFIFIFFQNNLKLESVQLICKINDFFGHFLLFCLTQKSVSVIKAETYDHLITNLQLRFDAKLLIRRP